MDFLLTPSRKVHGLQPGTKYQAPPMDGSLTLPEIYDFHYEHNPDHPVFVYPNSSGGTTTITYSQLVPAAHEAARFLAEAVGLDLNAEPSAYPVVGVLAASDTITFFTTILGAMRAGIPLFLISYRNSPVAVAHLLHKVGIRHCFVSSDAPTQRLANDGLQELEKDGRHLPEYLSMPIFEDIYLNSKPFTRIPPKKLDYSSPAVIIHSSGTSSFPKPIPWSVRTFLQAAMAPLLGSQDLCGEVFGYQSIAMFHAIGVIVPAFMAATGLVMGTFPPASPAVIPTPDAVFKGIVETKATYAFVVPSFIEMWAQDPAKVKVLAKLKGLLYSGAPMNKVAGDYLASKGVELVNIYGMSEVALIAKFVGDPMGKDWEYFEINPHCAAETVPNEDGSFETFIVDKPTQSLPVANAMLNNMRAYATGDLLLQHPTRPTFWKILGRSDEQIMLSTGEKTNPAPLEGILRTHPYVAAAVMFGRGRFQNGVLIELKPEYAFDPKDTTKLAQFKDAIWPKIEELNEYAPSHSRLFKEMILVASPHKPFTYSAKRAPKRNIILQEYEFEIEELYALVEEQLDLTPPADWTYANSLTFVRAAVSSVLRRNIPDDQDIFEFGCDSLQATWIRRTIAQALRKSVGESAADLPFGFVYEHPSISALAKFAVGTADPTCRSSNRSRAAELESLVRRYTSSFPVHTPSESLPGAEGEVVLVTGTTGSLGSAALAELHGMPSVRHVYALNRRSSKRGLLARQEEALTLRGYDKRIASSPKVTLVEGSLARSGLGTGNPKLEHEIAASLTHIVHVAWRVDFNLNVASFENNIGGVRALVDLALSSPRSKPPRLVFVSSIGIFRNMKAESPVPETPIEDAEVPAGQGYAESKWVSEQILYAAARETPIEPVVVRVGQISGGIKGAWNTSDWVPTIVKSSVALGCLPVMEGADDCSWVNLDLAGKILAELRRSSSRTVHLVHPRPARWADLVKVVSRELDDLPVVPYAEWVGLLEAEAERANAGSGTWRDNPALLLLDFFQGALRSSSESSSAGGSAEAKEIMGTAKLCVENGLRESETFRDETVMRRLGEEDVKRWIAFWREVGFL